MDGSVYIPIDIDMISDAKEKPSKTYKLDFENGRISGFIDGIEAVKQAIKKALLTPRFKCLIYNDQYGSEIEDAVTAKDSGKEYICAVIPGFVKDCLKPDSRIIGVKNFDISFSGDEAYISFEADTIFGKVNIEEVL